MITPSYALTATERVLPKLALDFTTASLDPRITFTRSGATATRVNSSGYIETMAADTPRFDFNPITLICKGLLIEEARTNYAVHSQDFSSTWAGARSSISTNATTSPTNASNAAKIVEDSTASNSHYIGLAVTVGSAGAVTISVYAKKDERSWIVLYNTSSVAGKYFDVENGVAGSDFSGTPTSFSITPAGDGWYRCTVTTTVATTASNVRVYLASGNNGAVYNGDGSSGAYVYGFQCEQGAFATSYIPTTTTALTRNADVATITGTNFSDWWQASKGGAQVQAIPSTVSGIRPLVQYDDGTANEIIALRGNTTNPELYVVDGGTPQAQLDAGTIAANTAYSLTGWWATNDCKARKDSGAVVTDDTATIPTVTQARLGSDGTNYLNGHLATVNYYDSFFGQSIYTRRKNKVIFSLL